VKTEQYKYDVAFSFLAKDEALATELNDRLQDRVKTFLYTRKQEQIAGTDGEKTFNKVFGEEARIVVLLYRKDWGQTPFTRIEETAIKNRGFDHGYDFLLCIPLDEPPIAPEWYPKTNLWLGLSRWGVDGAASVIEARIQERGGQPHEETVQERAQRLKRSQEFAGKRDSFLHSEDGVKAANEEFELLRAEAQRLTNEIGSSFSYKSHENHFAVIGMGFSVGLEWQLYYGNSLTNSKLTVGLWKGHPPLHFPQQYMLHQPQQIQKTEFTFDLFPADQHRWVMVGNKTCTYTIQELAAHYLKELMNQCEAAFNK
jgi:hypothetical protein